MRPLKSLTMDAVIEHLRKTFEAIPDGRAADQVLHGMADTLMSGFGMMFFQHPSLLNFQRAQAKEHPPCNLQTIFKVRAVPSDTPMRVILDGTPTEPLRATRPAWFTKMQRAGSGRPIQNGRAAESGREGCVYQDRRVLHDGAGRERVFSRPRRSSVRDVCGRRRPTGWCTTAIRWSVRRWGKPGRIGFCRSDAEEVRNTDGHEKQDGEVKAGKRLVRRRRQEHRQRKRIVTGDDRYAHEPFVDERTELRMHYVLVAKPESHKELFEWVEGLERQGLSEHGSWEEGPAGAPRINIASCGRCR